jgi:hypothetical protein
MSGIFGPVGNTIPLTAASLPPEAYSALLALFGGDEEALAAFVASTTQTVVLSTAVGRATDFTAELDQPVTDLAFSAPAVPLAGSVGRATDL